MTQVGILGAGFAGLSAAWLLKSHGIDSVILEKNNYTGGLARSFTWNGFNCDFAAHRLFTNDEGVLQQLLNLVPMGRHIRRSRIYLGENWLRDPLDVLELATNLPASNRLRMVLDYFSRPRNLPDDCFENYVIRRYGRSLYELFFQPYTEKLFGIGGKDISVYWAEQKVRLANPLDNYRENTKTKFQYFYYPVREGYGAIADRLSQEIQSQIKLEATVQGFNTSNGKITHIKYTQSDQQATIPVDYVISTLPMTITSKMLGYDASMNYRKVDAVYLHLNRTLLSDLHWMYFVNQDIAINRMVEFKNMSAVDTPAESTVICAEVTQDHPDVVRKVVSDLSHLSLINSRDVLDTKVVHEKFAYPVYDQYYDKNIETFRHSLAKFHNLQVLGRAAEFRHREVDDNFASAIQVVNHIVQEMRLSPVDIEVRKEMVDSMASPLIYAVILTYNHYEDTHECLSSMFESDYSNFQVVLVDNGSDDGTPQNVREDFPDVHVIENDQNLGVPAGYNIGFQYALKHGAHYILMLNNDVIFPPNMLSELFSVAEDDPGIGMVMPKILYHGSDERVWSSGGRYRTFPPAILMTEKRSEFQDKLRLIEYAPGCGLLIHRQAFEKAGLFDPGYFFLWDDWDFSERVRAHGLHIWYAPNATMWHKVSTTTQGPRSSLYWRTYGTSITRFYRRHGRPAWLSIPLHLGYVIFRDIILKRNWGYWSDFQQGIREGLQKPLGSFPQSSSGRAQFEQ